MAQLYTMEHPSDKEKKNRNGQPVTAPTTLAGFEKVYKKRGWKLTKESEERLANEKAERNKAAGTSASASASTTNPSASTEK